MFFGRQKPAGLAATPPVPELGSDGSPAGLPQELILIFDLNGKCVYSTLAAAAMFGLTPGAAAGRTPDELGLSDAVGDTFRSDLGRVFLTGNSVLGGTWLPSDDGYRYFEYNLIPVTASRQGVDFVNATFEDKTRTRRAEKALRRSEEQFAKLFRLSPGLMLLLETATGKVVESNDAWLTAAGLSRRAVVGKTLAALAGEGGGLPGVLEAELRTGREWKNRYAQFRNAAGETRTVILSAEPLVVGDREHCLCAAQDITEREKMAREIGRFERLNLVGQMAAGLGHEIRNPMTTIRGFLQLLGGKEEYQADRGFFELMIGELDRANGIITEFLKLARDRKTDFRQQDLNALLINLLPLLEADAMLAGKEIHTELSEIPWLCFDAKEITQVVLNLARNGLEAMPSGGKLTLRTGADAGGVYLSVKDNGPGIPPQLLDKLGTPFFTTKDNGTGLGLATCYSIAGRHQARLLIDSGPGGTDVRLVFPPSAAGEAAGGPEGGPGA